MSPEKSTSHNNQLLILLHCSIPQHSRLLVASHRIGRGAGNNGLPHFQMRHSAAFSQVELLNYGIALSGIHTI